MADGTKIEWTEATWNPITGCSVVSPGCTNCYAMRLAGTRMKHHESRIGLTDESKAGPVWNGQVRFNQQWLDQPLRWKKPRMIFVCAHGDLFHENVPDEWIDQVFAVMALAPQHTFQVLTKRADRMRRYCSDQATPFRVARAETPIEWPLPQCWLGVSAEDQQRADERIPLLLQTPAAVRWVSAEPLLGPIDFKNVPGFNRVGLDLSHWWIVAGGESGPGSRPAHPDWFRSLRDQCVAAGVPFFFKQWGDWLWNSHDEIPAFLNHEARNRWCYLGNDCFKRIGKQRAGNMLDGRTWMQYPDRRG